MSRITIFSGHYGSGKTELALNYAVKLREAKKDVIIVDLDIVNAFYRTKDAQELLSGMGIEVLSPTYANTNVDIPALPADILKVFANKSKDIVFDVGGDEDGAIALGGYFHYFKQENHKMYAVINTKRPLTDSKENIILMVDAINRASRLTVCGLINNTNLSLETTASDVIEGEKIVLAAAKDMGLPLVFTSVQGSLADEVMKKSKQEVFVLNKYLRLPWQNE